MGVKLEFVYERPMSWWRGEARQIRNVLVRAYPTGKTFIEFKNLNFFDIGYGDILFCLYASKYGENKCVIQINPPKDVNVSRFEDQKILAFGKVLVHNICRIASKPFGTDQERIKQACEFAQKDLAELQTLLKISSEIDALNLGEPIVLGGTYQVRRLVESTGTIKRLIAELNKVPINQIYDLYIVTYGIISIIREAVIFKWAPRKIAVTEYQNVGLLNVFISATDTIFGMKLRAAMPFTSRSRKFKKFKMINLTLIRVVGTAEQVKNVLANMNLIEESHYLPFKIPVLNAGNEKVAWIYFVIPDHCPSMYLRIAENFPFVNKILQKSRIRNLHAQPMMSRFAEFSNVLTEIYTENRIRIAPMASVNANLDDLNARSVWYIKP